jgi:hypothetical protein
MFRRKRLIYLIGYILELHRIPYGIECGPEKGNKRVVFIQHGLLCDSSNFVMTGVQKGLGINPIRRIKQFMESSKR